MANSYEITFISITIVVFILGILLASYLIKKRNTFPYSNITPFWMIFSLISILMSQLFSVVSFATGENSIYFDIINLLFIHILIISPLIVRAYTLGESIKYNSSHLTRRFYDTTFQRSFEEHFNIKFHRRNFYFFKIFILPLLGCFIFNGILLAIPATRDSIVTCLRSFSQVDFESEGGDRLLGTIILNLYLMVEICVYITMIYRFFLFKIKEDKFYLKVEFISLFVIWYCSHNIIVGIIYFTGNKLRINFIDTCTNLILVLCYTILTYIRSKISFEEIAKLLKDFNLFMNCTITFNVFKDYIKNTNEDDYKLLSFWVECNVFREQIDNLKSRYNIPKRCSKTLTNSSKLGDNYFNCSLLSEDKAIIAQFEEELKDMAEGIFLDYFGLNTSRMEMNSIYQIEFPIDIYEKVAETYKKSFHVEHYENLFADAFIWVEAKLHEIFEEFCQTENRNLEKIIFFMDYYELRKQDLARTTTYQGNSS